MSRQRSPAPPTLPPKDSSSSLASSYRRSNYVNNDLAEAVRDSVQFGSKQSSPNIDFSDPSGFKQRPSSSLNPPVPRRTPSPRLPINNERPQNGVSDDYYNNHNNRVSFVPAMMGQPQLPSQRVISAQNPFESDEIEPPPGPLRPPGVQAAAGRQKLARAQTAQGANTPISSSSANLLQHSPTAKTRPRRSMSSGSYGLDAKGRELTAGQKKALEDKKGGKHNDVIDTWDPTGLGDAMWHHSGPYDAAAPSRNQNQPQAKAPMRAFNAQQAAQAAAEAQAQAQSQAQNQPANGSPTRTGPSVSLATPPVPPAKDINEGPMRRAQAAIDRKPTSNPRRTSGGLTGQYSTSMPTSGGYFPDMAAEPTDEAEIARRERQRQREEKRRALKAAWGIDNPEPFEDYGASPGEGGNLDLTEELCSPDYPAVPLPGGGRPARSPGVRHAGTTPPIFEDVPSPNGEPGAPSSYRGGQTQTGGVKRTKSLMQKIKTMVRTRSGSIEESQHAPMPLVLPGRYHGTGYARANAAAAGGGTFAGGQRSQSMSAGLGYARPVAPSSPGWGEREVVQEDDEEGEERFEDAREDFAAAPERPRAQSRDSHNKSPLRSSSPRADSMPTSPPRETPPQSDKHESAPNSRLSIFGRSPHADPTARSPSPKKSSYTMAFEEETPLPEAGDFVFVESPNAKTRAATAQRGNAAKERAHRYEDPSWTLAPPVLTNGNAVETLQDSTRNGLANGHGATINGSTSLSSSGLSGRPSTKNRAKNLPTPPVMPVFPDFDDLLPTRTMSRTDKHESGEGVKRKPSMVKKLKDRIK